MAAEIKEHDMVVFVDDLPPEALHATGSPLGSAGIQAGQTGAVVHIHDAGRAFEVEVPLGGGKFAVVTVERQYVLKLLDVPDSLTTSS